MNNTLRSHSYRLQAIDVDVTLTLFSNKLLVVVSQLGKFGSVIKGKCINL